MLLSESQSFELPSCRDELAADLPREKDRRCVENDRLGFRLVVFVASIWAINPNVRIMTFHAEIDSTWKSTVYFEKSIALLKQ